MSGVCFTMLVLMMLMVTQVFAGEKGFNQYSALGAQPTFGWYSSYRGKVPKVSFAELRKYDKQVVVVKLTPVRKLSWYEIQRKKFRLQVENAYETREGVYLVDVKRPLELHMQYQLRGYVSKAIKKSDFPYALHPFEQSIIHPSGLPVVTSLADVEKGEVGEVVIARAVPTRTLVREEVVYWLGEDERWIAYETAEKGLYLAFPPGTDTVKDKFDGMKIAVKGRLRLEKRGISNNVFVLAE